MYSSRREFMAGVGAAAFLGGCGAWDAKWGADAAELVARARRAKYNILFIMTDDHAAHAISAYGSKVNKTPHIDSLAKDGMLFTDVMCTNPICGPSRASILTGRYSHMNGVPSFVPISPSIETVGGYLRKAGYYTAFVGKWHVGGPETVRDQDWDKWMIYLNQGVYFDPFFVEKDESGAQKFKTREFKGEYATENITRVTQEVLDDALESGKPFFAMMHHKAPHRNWLPSGKYRKSFRFLTLTQIPPPATLFDTHKGRASAIKTTAMTILRHMRLKEDLKVAEYFADVYGNPFEFEGRMYFPAKDMSGRYIDGWPVDESGAQMGDRAKTAFSYLRYMQDYLACVQSVDDSVGEMLDYLKRKGIDRKTLVVYTSDQGFFLGDHGLYDKRFIMEETLKMPFIVRCPGLVEAGSVNGDIVTNVDFAPTFLDLAGAAKPDGMQGDSFLTNMAGETPSGWKEACYCRYYVEGGEHNTAAWYGVRTKTEKLVFYYKRGEWEYFDMESDPEELENRYSDPSKADRVAALKKLLADLRNKYSDNERYSECSEYSL